MTRRREDNAVEKHTLNLFVGDFHRLQDMHPDIGAGAVIRRLVREHLQQVDGKVKVRVPKVEGIEL